MRHIDKILNEGPFVWLEDELRPRLPSWLFISTMISLALITPWGLIAIIGAYL